jgi:hypothetical protein
MASEAYYALRYLPPKTNGNGTVVAACSVDNSEFDLNEWRRWQPEVFKELGFYTLMRSTGKTLSVEPKQEDPKACKHPNRVPGERIPLRYGSAATTHCVDCGKWVQDRTLGQTHERWEPREEYIEALERDDDV